MEEAEGGVDGDLRAPYTEEHRRCAQEVISAHIRGEGSLLATLLTDYCRDGCLLSCFLDFFYASVVSGDSSSASVRFQFLQWMLGDLLEDMASERGMRTEEVVVELMHAAFTGLPPELDLAVQAAQTTLASHMLARTGRKPWGIQESLSTEGLSRLTAGVHILLWVLCFEAREQLGDVRIITHLLPHLTNVLQMSADAAGSTLEEFTSALWLLHLSADAGLLE